MYESMGGKEMQFSVLIVLETDDFFGGGIGDQYRHAVGDLRKRYNFGKWVELMDESHEYGERTVRQLPYFAHLYAALLTRTCS